MGGVIVGIDYGSKTSGFTCAAVRSTGGIQVHQSTKNKDADRWLTELISPLKPALVGMDAPLSLPGALRGLPNYSNYHYREADIASKAMSPMFLGGLTARAIALKNNFEVALGSEVIEVYPKLAMQYIGLDPLRYKKDKYYLSTALSVLAEKADWGSLEIALDNWHQFDALLALYSSERYLRENAEKLGDEAEGLIYF